MEFVIWGCAGHAKVLAEVIKLNGGSVIALFDNKDVPSILPNVKMYKGKEGFSEWIKTIRNPKEIAGLVAIGGSNGLDRRKIQLFLINNGLQVPSMCHPSAVISDSAYVGNGTQVLALANVAADVYLGDACIVNNRASIDHECKIGNGAHLGPGSTLCGCVNVGEDAFIGAGAIVLPRLTIGEEAIVGAGAVVTRNVLPGVTVIGNPAKPMIK